MTYFFIGSFFLSGEAFSTKNTNSLWFHSLIQNNNTNVFILGMLNLCQHTWSLWTSNFSIIVSRLLHYKQHISEKLQWENKTLHQVASDLNIVCSMYFELIHCVAFSLPPQMQRRNFGGPKNCTTTTKTAVVSRGAVNETWRVDNMIVMVWEWVCY